MVKSQNTVKIGIDERGCGVPLLEEMRTHGKSKAREIPSIKWKFNLIIANMSDRLESLEYSFQVLEYHIVGNLETLQIKVKEVMDY